MYKVVCTQILVILFLKLLQCAHYPSLKSESSLACSRRRVFTLSSSMLAHPLRISRLLSPDRLLPAAPKSCNDTKAHTYATLSARAQAFVGVEPFRPFSFMATRGADTGRSRQSTRINARPEGLMHDVPNSRHRMREG
jgi:hypothetical protein